MNSKPTRENNGGRVVVWTVLGLIVLFGGAYVAAYFGAGEKVPRGATVADVEIGGLTHDEAVAKLKAAFAERETIDVTVDGKATTVTAEDAGLALDAEASVGAAGGGKSWSPARLWDYYTGGDDFEAELDTDDAAIEAVVADLDEEFGKPPKEGDVSFKGGKVRAVKGKNGLGVDVDSARTALREAYTSGETAELKLTDAAPEVDQADVQQALNEFGNPAVSAPVTLLFGDAPVKLTPKEFAPVLGMKPEDGELVPHLKQKKLASLVKSRVADDKGAPVDASVELVNGKPQVIPAKPGVDYDPADISEAFLELVVRDPGDREMKVKATVKPADFTTKEARELGIKKRVSTFTTHYPHADYRNINLGRAAELINGTVLKPGEIFSLNDIVGERTRENGFTEGFIISNGVFKSDLGGGVSQMATTLFNSMFFAGLEDVEHRAHSFYIDRYPVGREATVVWGALDLRFRNDTDHGVLVQSFIKPSTPGTTGSVTVNMYSTKTWDITTKTSDRYNFTSPGTRTLTTADCYPNSGYGGFDVDVWRYFHEPGSDTVHHTEKFHTTYTPSDTVVCKEPEPTPPPKKPEDGDGGNGGDNGDNGGN